MKRQMFTAIFLGGGLIAGAAQASSDCSANMSQWQSPEAVQAAVEAMGLRVRSLRTDDGCYKVYSHDARGNYVELQLEPDTLEIRELEVEFVRGGRVEEICALGLDEISPGDGVPLFRPSVPENSRSDSDYYRREYYRLKHERYDDE
jgi:hypothetical protein